MKREQNIYVFKCCKYIIPCRHLNTYKVLLGMNKTINVLQIGIIGQAREDDLYVDHVRITGEMLEPAYQGKIYCIL